MKKLIVAAFAALALFGCNASDKPETPAAPPPVEQTVLRPAPQPIAPVTNADIDACKDAWASAWAKEHDTTVAAAERHARRISTTPPTTLRINGQDYVFGARNKGATVWSTCEASLKAARAAPAQATAATQDPGTAALIADLRTENARLATENRTLRDLAYENPRETDADKLIPYKTKASDLERQRDDLNGFTVMDGFWLFLGVIIGVCLYAFVIKPRLGRRKANRTIGS